MVQRTAKTPWRHGPPLAAGLAIVLALGGCSRQTRSTPLSAEGGPSTVNTTPVLAPPLVLRAGDYTQMGWAEGFPSHTPQAPWLRVIQTGSYAMVLDTERLQVPHFGPVGAKLGYAACAQADNAVWRALPPAELGLTLRVDGKVYRCTGGSPWTSFGGPRLIESGRFLQRADVTGLAFAAADGSLLNAEARFETVAWPERLALILAVRPGVPGIPAGESCFGRLGGGFGFDGTNHLEVPHSPELEPEQFTLELWAFVPQDCQASDRLPPWLVCKNGNEWGEGNYGLLLVDGRPRACLNIGGGRENAFAVDAQGSPALQIEAWNHLAVSYDGDSLRIYVNGQAAGECRAGRRRVPGTGGLAFGRRQDNSGDGYHFRGAIDEVRLYDRALDLAEIQARASTPEVQLAAVSPVREWSFRADGQAAQGRPAQPWRDVAMEVRLEAAAGAWHQRWELPAGQEWGHPEWREVALVLAPGGGPQADPATAVVIRATEVATGVERPVAYDALRGWHRVDLDGVEPAARGEGPAAANDAMERVRLVLTNPDPGERTVQLLFAKTAGGFRQHFGAAITGMSAILRDADGQPTGIPVQLSKNWHGRPEGGVYSGAWFHGLSQVRLAPGATTELELSIVYGHWGGVAAASHAQLCLIGWGSNQLWDESALGAWGESICYEPDQAQAQAAVLDVRPLMVRSMNNNQPWNWTHNVGGADFFRLFDPAGKRVFPARMRTAYLRQCPVLTEVLYAGQLAEGRIEHQATVSLCRSDDLVRGVYRLRLDVKRETAFSRFVVFQIGADSYSYTGERTMALGNETGLSREWATEWGGDQYRTEPMVCSGRVPWVSLHGAVPRPEAKQGGAWANRGVVIREWRARLGGAEVAPWVAEYGVKARGSDTSTIDLVPPPGVTRFLPGDFVEATIEHVIVPQSATDYYGPNAALRAALEKGADTWRMVHREAVGNDRQVEVTTGRLRGLFPAVRIEAAADRAEFAITGGLGYVPITLAGLRPARGPRLEVREPGSDWWPVDQSVHGNDFWQTDYDPAAGRWEVTFSVPSDAPDDQPRRREYRFGVGPM